MTTLTDAIINGEPIRAALYNHIMQNNLSEAKAYWMETLTSSLGITKDVYDEIKAGKTEKYIENAGTKLKFHLLHILKPYVKDLDIKFTYEEDEPNEYTKIGFGEEEGEPFSSDCIYTFNCTGNGFTLDDAFKDDLLEYYQLNNIDELTIGQLYDRLVANGEGLDSIYEGTLTSGNNEGNDITVKYNWASNTDY